MRLSWGRRDAFADVPQVFWYPEGADVLSFVPICLAGRFGDDPDEAHVCGDLGGWVFCEGPKETDLTIALKCCIQHFSACPVILTPESSMDGYSVTRRDGSPFDESETIRLKNLGFELLFACENRLRDFFADTAVPRAVAALAGVLIAGEWVAPRKIANIVQEHGLVRLRPLVEFDEHVAAGVADAATDDEDVLDFLNEGGPRDCMASQERWAYSALARFYGMPTRAVLRRGQVTISIADDDLGSIVRALRTVADQQPPAERERHLALAAVLYCHLDEALAQYDHDDDDEPYVHQIEDAAENAQALGLLPKGLVAGGPTGSS